MADEEFIENLIEAYNQTENTQPIITTNEATLTKSVITFMLKVTREQPPLPEHINPRTDKFTTFHFLVHHQPGGSAKVSARSMASASYGAEDIGLAVEILRQYLDTIAGIGPPPPTAH